MSTERLTQLIDAASAATTFHVQTVAALIVFMLQVFLLQSQAASLVCCFRTGMY